MRLFQKKNTPTPTLVQTARPNTHSFSMLDNYSPLAGAQNKLYDTLREAVPVIDAALLKIIRLIGGYTLSCPNKVAEEALNHFAKTIAVGGVSQGLEAFLCSYLDNLLLYGNAVGEIVLSSTGKEIIGLYNANLDHVVLKQGKSPLDISVWRKDEIGNCFLVPRQELILFSALNPNPSCIYGNSILKGLPFVSNVLLRIFESISNNFERMGNLRYAVTYKPSNDNMEKSYAKDRAMQIAKEWSDGMTASRNGQLTDFIAVGDVNIRVIGADNQMMDTNVPVRQMLEQIVAKLGIPPFLLGLSWTTTERMSKQQSDILTSELEYYRRLLTPMLLKICNTFLRLNGYSDNAVLEWDVINLQDETEQAKADLYRAQSEQIYQNIERSC